MNTIGDTLREARHTRQMTLEEAARATKVKVDILEHLEAGEYASLPGVTYTKSFLKIYAEHLGLDGQALVEEFVKSQGGVRRVGGNLETEANLRLRKPNELRLSRRTLVMAVAAMTLVMAGAAVLKMVLWPDRAPSAENRGVEPLKLTADFEPFYTPSERPMPPADANPSGYR